VSVATADAQATFAATLVDEWVRAGVTHAVVCPGSRSTPLVLALADRDEIELHVRLDERGACFFAVGLAVATGVPSVVCTTSGTAAAELHAGVVEASHAGVPLIVCTADRPPRLHGVGAPQTIEQSNLYGGAVRWFFEPGPAERDDTAGWRSIGARSVVEAVTGAGPVHLNLAFDEPLLGTAGPLPEGRAGGAPWAAPAARPSIPVDIARDVELWGRPGVIVAGGGTPVPPMVLEVADRLGWPVLADPRSGLRIDHPAVIAAADAFLRDPGVRDALTPGTVLSLGGPWASRIVGEFLADAVAAGAEIVAVNPSPTVDPDRVKHQVLRGDPVELLEALAGAPVAGQAQWRERWEQIEAAAQGAIDKTLDNDPLSAGGRASEPGVLRHLLADLDAAHTLVVASSMPIRDLEWFGAPRANPPRVLANRGANGIDGVTSTALGVAAGVGGPVVAVLGDLAFLHDVSALVPVGDATGSCTLVVLDNDGGGIFSFLPQAGALAEERFERLFGTAPRVSIGEVARGFGLPVADVSTLAELDEALGRFVGVPARSVIRVALPSRTDNVALHERIHRAVGESARLVLAG
jgi:2-succinyl-5-enolpyruvyl-6-hydroxy-3-cyclohexene-1-carboxylate synthase